MENKNTGQKIVHFPVTKIVVGILIVGGLYGLAQFSLSELLKLSSLTEEWNPLIIGIFSCGVGMSAYILLYRRYERRRITELSTAGMGKNLGLGILLGGVLQSLTILFIAIMGGFKVIALNRLIFMIPALTMAFTAAIFEEILLRGIIFRIIEEKLGSYLALLISALLFGAMHLANPNSSLAAALGIAVQAGILLAAAYMYARNLWFPIAIHFAWNFTQSGIFGAIVSGNSLEKSLLTTKIEGAAWYTGGPFGPEGSVQATLFCFIAALVLLFLSHKQHKIVKPFWKEKTIKPQ